MNIKLFAGLLGLFSVISISSYSQVSQKYFGRTNRSEHIVRSTILRSGNRVGVGHAFFGSNTAGSEAMILCLDPSDNIVWSKEISTTGTDRLMDVAATDDSGFVAVGYIGAAGSTSALVLKISAAGNILWSKTFKNTTPGEIFYRCAVMPNGH